jgi:bacteriorhodopsin
MITLIAALSYFAMATGMGFRFNVAFIHERHGHGIPDTFKVIYRQVFWARYVDWTLTTPLLLLDLSLLAGMSGANILVAVLADVIMCLTGLFASFGREHNGSRWGWCAFFSNSVPESTH